MAGLRSATPPNQDCEVEIMRQFMWKAGTKGDRGWMTMESPAAQNCPSLFSAPFISCRKRGENSPDTVEILTPAFSKTRPFLRIDISPPPPDRPESVLLSQGRFVNTPGARFSARGWAQERSSWARLSHIRLRKSLIQDAMSCCCCWVYS